jgi:DNA processing protein
MSTDREQARAARATLALLDPTRNEALRDLLGFFGPVEGLAWLTAPNREPEEQAEFLHGVSIRRLLDHHATVAEVTAQAGARVLIPEDDDWPARLDDYTRVAFTAAPSSALCLWIRGNADPATAFRNVVAVTGTRNPSPYGISVASDLGHGLTRAGWTVATGSSAGIDSAVTGAALAAGGPVIAVVPSGLDRPHSYGTNGLFEQITERGLLISVQPPGTKAGATRFTAARRLLAGLGSGTVVVEASEHSTALTALDETISRGRPAMVVPGPATPAMSAGMHAVLRDRRSARVVHHTADVLAELPTGR